MSYAVFNKLLILHLPESSSPCAVDTEYRPHKIFTKLNFKNTVGSENRKSKIYNSYHYVL